MGARLPRILTEIRAELPNVLRRCLASFSIAGWGVLLAADIWWISLVYPWWSVSDLLWVWKQVSPIAVAVGFLAMGLPPPMTLGFVIAGLLAFTTYLLAQSSMGG
jgi:hypothetical protein